jgi:hypothetical protein
MGLAYSAVLPGTHLQAALPRARRGRSALLARHGAALPPEEAVLLCPVWAPTTAEAAHPTWLRHHQLTASPVEDQQTCMVHAASNSGASTPAFASSSVATNIDSDDTRSGGSLPEAGGAAASSSSSSCYYSAPATDAAAAACAAVTAAAGGPGKLHDRPLLRAAAATRRDHSATVEPRSPAARAHHQDPLLPLDEHLSSELWRAAPDRVRIADLAGLRALRFATDAAPFSAAAADSMRQFTDTLVQLEFVACLEMADDHLVHVAAMQRLRSLTLDCCVHLSDAALDTIAALGPRLRRLSLKGCKQLARVSTLKTLVNLEALSLEQCVLVNDAQLAAALAPMNRLRLLNVAHCFRITADAFFQAWLTCENAQIPTFSRSYLASRTNGEQSCLIPKPGLHSMLRGFLSLDLRFTLVDGDIWLLLAHMPALRMLLLAGTAITDNTYGVDQDNEAHVEEVQEDHANAQEGHQGHGTIGTINEINTSNNAIIVGAGDGLLDGANDAGVRYEGAEAHAISVHRGACGPEVLSSMHNLRQLDVGKTVIGDHLLKAIHTLPRLETLGLAYTHITDMAIARYVAKMRSLSWLSLEQTAVTDFALERLSGLVNLFHLDLSDTLVSSFGATVLSCLSNIRSLTLSFTKVSDLTMRSLESLQGLQVLSLENIALGDGGLGSLGQLPQLKELELYAAKITDTGLLKFCCLPAARSLLVLDLGSCVLVGDVSLKHGVTRMRQLEQLNLSYTCVTDVGAVALLAALPKLTLLNLSHTDVTDRCMSCALAHPALRRLHMHGCNLKNPPSPAHSVPPSAVRIPALELIA